MNQRLFKVVQGKEKRNSAVYYMACWSGELCERPKIMFPSWFEIAANSGCQIPQISVWLFVGKMSVVSLFLIFSRNLILKQKSLLNYFFLQLLYSHRNLCFDQTTKTRVYLFFSYGVYIYSIFFPFSFVSFFASPPLYFPGFSLHDPKNAAEYRWANS